MFRRRRKPAVPAVPTTLVYMDCAQKIRRLTFRSAAEADRFLRSGRVAQLLSRS